jgi:hypothetical protein
VMLIERRSSIDFCYRGVIVAGMITLALMLTLMHGAASEYWTATGVPTTCTSSITLAEGLPSAGRARIGGCAIELNQEWIRERYGVVADRGWTPRRWRRDAALQICLTVVHEEGHARGLLHTEAGIMSERMWDEEPWECMQVIRPLIRRQARQGNGAVRTDGRSSRR